ncbi:Uma2 family endonuclease [Leptolyngbya cf. ectocarpi LEGE 11479]|uniref:Uma2 family endonuclease n=1 Tax=Leptolyngbya cf. ectocarpi LEGE 11479 TaxID=1828722 RepID=A0A928ZWZ5_LEPEC|nr:Uma2 family endonuclease [Leptolyngbya ectocarpi]MBE9068983.1 Uma2 family endonuclease [Leptolyngbya cf. ectocarpi LEGE 11479]
MVQSDLRTYLPPSTELPDSDDIPVDNEDQNLIPNVLLFLLNFIWPQRQDWYFGVDMGIYHTTGAHPRVPVVPDGFLSLGVERRKNGQSRRSYVLWEENDIAPTLVLEVVSWTPGAEYTEKLEIYRRLGVLYYVIYNPNYWQRDGHQPFELYKLVNNTYQLQLGEPFWMPEVGLAIGRYPGSAGGIQKELLGWFDAQGKRYLTPEEKAERLAARLRELGEDPDQL